MGQGQAGSSVVTDSKHPRSEAEMESLAVQEVSIQQKRKADSPSLLKLLTK